MTQADQILAHMQSGKTITSFQSFRLFDCTRLPDRIRDLRERGIEVQSQWLKLPSGRRCCQYWI
jgi:hypothetical protein